MFNGKKKPGLAFLLVLSLVLTGIPFPGNVDVVSAVTPTNTEVTTSGIVDEDWNGFAVDTAIADTSGTNYSWNNRNSSKYKGTAKIVSKEAIGGSAEDKCVSISNDASAETPGEAQFDLVVAAQAAPAVNGETDYAVVEWDMYIDNTTETYNIMVLDRGTGTFVIREKITGGKWLGQTFSDGFHNLMLVINKATAKYTVYYDGNIVGSWADHVFYNNNVVPEVSEIYFTASVDTDKTTPSAMYIDNVKIYEVAADPMATPGPATPAPSPTAVPVGAMIIDQNWEGLAVGTPIMEANGTNYTWDNLQATYKGEAKIVAKSDAVAGAEGNALALPNSAVQGRYDIVIADYAIPEVNGETNFLTVEWDMYIDNTTESYDFMLMDRTGNTYVIREKISGGKYLGQTFTDGFHSVKIVINKASLKYSAYVDGALLGSYTNHAFYTGAGVAHVSELYISPAKTVSEAAPGSMYLDNIKVYESAADPMATPGPTPEPTSVPVGAMIIDQNWEGLTVGTPIMEANGTNYTWDNLQATYKGEAKIVAKSDAVAGAEGNALALPNSAVQGRYDIVIAEHAIPEVNGETNFLTVEWDMYIDNTTESYDFMLMDRTGNTYVIREKISGGKYLGQNFTDGFHSVKIVINKATLKYSAYVDGALLGSYTNHAFNTSAGVAHVSELYISPAKTVSEAAPGCMYLDNIKVYESAADPMKTPAPTPDPTPVPVGAMIIEETWEDIETDTVLETTTGVRYHWNKKNASYPAIAKIVSKADVLAGEEGNCIFIPNTADQEGNFDLVIESDAPAISGETGYAVVEWDMYLSNASAQYTILLMDRDNSNARVDNTSISGGELDGCALTESFHNVKYVVNKEAKQFSLYVDNTYVRTASLYTPNLLEITEIYFQSKKYTDATATDGMYIDNLKVYESAADPMATPKPPVSVEGANVTLSDGTVACSEASPTIVSVFVDGEKLSEGTDYTAVYSDGFVTITGINAYTGEKKVTWTVTHASVDEKGYCTVSGCGDIANGKYALHGRSINLSDDIGVIFYMELTDAVERDDISMTISTKGSTTTISGVDAIYKKLEDGTETYGFRCGLYATEMNKEITAQFKINDQVVETYTYSISTYCANKKEDGESAADQKLMQLLDSVVVYGAKSQTYFGKDTNDLVTDQVEGAEELAPLEPAELEKLAEYGRTDSVTQTEYFLSEREAQLPMALVLYAQTALRAALHYADGYEMGDFTYEAYRVTATGDKPVEGYNGVYGNVDYFEIRNIMPTELDDTFKIVIKHEGNVIKEMTYSPFTYIYNMSNSDNAALVDVVTALYRYNKAAEAYSAE